MTKQATIQRSKSQYQACDDLVAYRGDRVVIVGRWWIGNPHTDGMWTYMVKDISTDQVVDDVPESDLSDW